MDTVYIETSIVNHATAWPSSIPEVAVLQSQAKQWLAIEAPKYKLVTTQLVIEESSMGDAQAVVDRMAVLAKIPILLPSDKVEQVADEIISRSLMPKKARVDALHVASAAVGSVEYLLTQNCRHIANAHTLPKVYKLLEELGYPRLLICTPAEFLGDLDDDS